MNLKAWLHGITAAAITAAATGLSAALTNPASFNLTHAGLLNLAKAAALPAVIAVLLILKQSPLPDGLAALTPEGTKTAAVIAIMCGSLFAASTIGLTGCTQAQRVSVAQEIVNWTPALTSAIDTAGGVVATLDPVTAPIVGTVVSAADALAPEFEKAAKAYLANPNQTTLQVLQALVVQIQNDVNSSLTLLEAAHVDNPTSQRTALALVNAIATVANTLLALVQSISSKVQVAAMSSQVTVHLATVRGVLDRGQLQMASNRVAADLRMPAVTVDEYFSAETRAGF